MSELDSGQPPDAYREPEGGRTIPKSIPFTKTEEWLIERKNIKLSGYGDFSGFSTQKLEDGRIRQSGWSPCNVDPDWGTYDTNNWERYYDSFEAFIERYS